MDAERDDSGDDWNGGFFAEYTGGSGGCPAGCVAFVKHVSEEAKSWAVLIGIGSLVLVLLNGCSVAVMQNAECYGASLASLNVCDNRNAVQNLDGTVVRLGPDGVLFASGGITEAATTDKADLQVHGGATLDEDGVAVSAERSIVQGQYTDSP